jgi:GNAT superfamily N-acetyltransferase
MSASGPVAELEQEQEQERDLLVDKVKRMIQKVILVRRTCNFVVVDPRDVKPLETNHNARLVPISVDNYQRVAEFRPPSRIEQYRQKLVRGEVGYFVECDGRMIGSNWATVNEGGSAVVARTVMRLEPKEGMTHDGVIAPRLRGQGFGAFMINRLVAILFREYDLRRIIIDVNVRNKASLRMMEKAGFRVDHEMLYVALFGKLVIHRRVKQYRREVLAPRDGSLSH